MTADWRATLERVAGALEGVHPRIYGEAHANWLRSQASALRGLLAEPQVNPSEAKELERERDEAILERDVMRRANVTPQDADRPLGQSVEHWQDQCLDYARHADRMFVRAVAAEHELKKLRAGLLAEGGEPEAMSGVDRLTVIARWECSEHGVVNCSEPTREGKRWCVLCLRFTMSLVEYVPVHAHRRAVDELGEIAHAFLAYGHAPLADQPTYRAEVLAKVREIVTRRYPCDCAEEREAAACVEGGRLCHDDTCQQTGSCIRREVARDAY